MKLEYACICGRSLIEVVQIMVILEFYNPFLCFRFYVAFPPFTHSFNRSTYHAIPIVDGLEHRAMRVDRDPNEFASRFQIVEDVLPNLNQAVIVCRIVKKPARKKDVKL